MTFDVYDDDSLFIGLSPPVSSNLGFLAAIYTFRLTGRDIFCRHLPALRMG